MKSLAFFFAICVLGLGCQSSEPGTPITDCTGVGCDLKPAPSCYYPTWGPSGDQVLYVHVPILGSHWDEASGRCVFDLDQDHEGTWIARTDGSEALFAVSQELLFADWHSNGWVVFQDFPQGISRVYVSDYGVELDSLEHVVAFGYRPRWSPDGAMIAFDIPTAGTYLVEASGGSPRLIATCVSPDWSPSGDLLVCSFQGQLVIVDTTGAIHDQTGVPGHYPRWSPGGTSIAYLHTESGENRPRIWLYDLEDRSTRQLSGEPVYSSGFYDWDPSGSRIVFIRYEGDTLDPVDGTLWTIEVSSGTAKPLTSEPCLAGSP